MLGHKTLPDQSARCRQDMTVPPRALIVDLIDPAAPALHCLHRGAERLLLQYRAAADPWPDLLAYCNEHAKALPVIIRVSAATHMERTVTLPEAARSAIRSILHYQLPSLTPWQPEDLYWSYRLINHDASNRRILVRLALVRRQAVQPLLDLLLKSRRTILWIEAAELPDRLVIRPTHAKRLAWPAALLPGPRVATGALCSLLCAVLFTSVLRQELAIQAARAALTELRPRIERAAHIRRELRRLEQAESVLPGRTLRLGGTMALFAALADTLPDDAYLTKISVEDGRVDIAGVSNSPANLLRAMSSNPGFHGITLGPLSQEGAGQSFSLHAGLAPQ